MNGGAVNVRGRSHWWRAVSSSWGPRVKGWAWSCAVVLCKWVSGFERGGESTRSMVRLPSIVYMAHLAAVGPLFPWPPVAPLPLSFAAWSSKLGVAGSRLAS
jgi:hypothetical protein